MTPSQFRADFPEFADTSKYPDALVTFWLTVTAQLVNTERWGNLSSQAQELQTAHFLYLAVRNRLTANTPGGIPGALAGIVSAQSVDDVSVSYDTANAINEDGGMWNQSSYGATWWRLARLMGAGPIQL